MAWTSISSISVVMSKPVSPPNAQVQLRAILI
jgi:hypothetical protein